MLYFNKGELKSERGYNFSLFYGYSCYEDIRKKLMKPLKEEKLGQMKFLKVIPNYLSRIQIYF